MRQDPSSLMVRHHPTLAHYLVLGVLNIMCVFTGELPDNAKINETETYGDMADGDAGFEFGEDEEDEDDDDEDDDDDGKKKELDIDDI